MLLECERRIPARRVVQSALDAAEVPRQRQRALFGKAQETRRPLGDLASPRAMVERRRHARRTAECSPCYSLTEGLQDARDAPHHANGSRRLAPGWFPNCCLTIFAQALKLPHIGDALRGGASSHATASNTTPAGGRLIFQDLLEMQLGLAMRRRAWHTRDAAARLPLSAKIDSRIRRLLPFQLTPGPESGRQARSPPISTHRSPCIACCRPTWGPARRSSPCTPCWWRWRPVFRRSSWPPPKSSPTSTGRRSTGCWHKAA